MVSNRLKPCLSTIINEDQTGFISGRFIGENTRMVYYTIEYCQSFNKKGLLMILDFSKAFDTIEWSFISEVLEIFNFGETFSQTIKLCQTNSTSKVEQNGYLSSITELQRGREIPSRLMSLFSVQRYYLMSLGKVGISGG